MLHAKPKTSVSREMREAREVVLLQLPFFGAISLGMDMVPTTDVQRAWSNGEVFKYNPDYFETATFDTKKWSIAGISTHLALKHHLRRGHRDKKRWNEACDIATFFVLRETNLVCPPDAIPSTPNLWKYQNNSAEEIYDDLEEQDGEGGDGEDEGEGEDTGGGGIDEIDDAVPNGDPADLKDKEKQWDNNIQQAINMQKRMGSGGKAVSRIVEEFKKQSQVDWRKELRDFIQKTTKGDYSWSQPNSRYFLTTGIYLPSLHSHELGSIAVGIDTSGSVGSEELKQFETELNRIFSEFPTKVYVIYCDDEVNRVDTYSPGDKIKLEAVGGGGTDFRPVFQYIQDKNLNPECLVYLTDCWGSYPKGKPRYPVLWGSTSEKEGLPDSYYPPFGRFIFVKV